MRIFYFLNTISGIGGISTITVNKINWLVENSNFEIVVFVKDHDTEFEEKYNGKLKIVNLGLNYSDLSFYNRFRYVFKIFRIFSYYKSEFNPNIVVSTLTSLDFFIIPLVFFRISTILEIHATSQIIIQWSHFIKKPFYKLYSKVVFLNTIEENHFKFKNSEVIPNFIPEVEYLNIYGKDKVVIAGGRNDVIKQWGHQIDAWNSIFNQLPEWEFHLYIDGEMNELEEYRSKVVSGCNNLKIFKATKEFKLHLRNASIMLLSSKVECFPMNILEAFSFGTAVVSYATASGPISLIQDGVNGVLVGQNNIQLLAEAILRIAKNTQCRVDLALKAKQLSSLYSEDNVMNQWLYLFNSLQE